MQLSPEQAKLIGAIIVFFPPVFQYIQYIASQPLLAPAVMKIRLFLRGYIPWNADTSKRIMVWGLTLLVIAVGDLSFLPALPVFSGFDAEYLTLLFVWGLNIVMGLSAMFLLMHGVYTEIWKPLFGGEMSSARIETAALRNSGNVG